MNHLYEVSGISPVEINGNPFWFSCLGNHTDRGVWQARIHGIARVRQHLVTKPPLPKDDTN